ncbi:CDP-glycerol glycerophosphotransferase family protein [Mammaliicoccus sciuri]
MEGFFGEAIPDFSLLLEKLQKNNILLIIKMHYLVKEDVQYLNIKNKYKNNPNIIFWDEEKDIYELFEDIDIGIVDYSSIYYDLLASGVTKFIRYIYDYENIFPIVILLKITMKTHQVLYQMISMNY